VLRVATPYELCVAAGRPDGTQPTPSPTSSGGGGAPTPTPTPTATDVDPYATPTPAIPGLVTLTVDPERAALRPGQTMAFKAIGTFADGSTRDVTEEVLWQCDGGNDFSCVAPNTPGDRGRVEGRHVSLYGSVTALDASNWHGGYAWLEVALEPKALVVHPWYTVIRQFDFDWLTAQRLEDGAYRNATQDVVWSSSDPTVAAATNPAGARSRIDAVGPGIAAIVATDPVSGAVSDPVTFEIFGPLRRMEIRAGGGGTAPFGGTVLDVGEDAWLNVWGFFDYGFTFERLRHGVTYSSSAPAVAAVEVFPNEYQAEYPYHMMTGVTVGTTVVSALDSLSGLLSTEHGCDLVVTVRNPALGIRLAPDIRRAGLDETIRLTALGVAVDGTTRNLTQRVTYTSSDPTVVEAPNEWGDRSALRTVGPGTATITAEEFPVYGRPPLTTNPLWVATIIVRNEHADRIVVDPPFRRTAPYTLPRFAARGHYPSGASNPVTDSVTWTTSDADVAGQSPFTRTRLYTRAVGTVTVTATMPTGVSSHTTNEDATLVVEAPDALSVAPPATTIAVGETTTFTALAHLPSGTTIDLLDRETTPDPRWAPVYFTTSAPNVARSPACGSSGYLYPTQPLIGLLPGTTTIRAVGTVNWRLDSGGTPPPLDSGASGGDATLTVVAP
jgi:hypothetical protein